MLVCFKDLKECHKKELIARRKAEAIHKRKTLLERFSKEVVDTIWYCKKEYIDNIAFDDDFLIDICENCGTPLTLATVIYDKAGNYGARDVLYKCPCGAFCRGF